MNKSLFVFKSSLLWLLLFLPVHAGAQVDYSIRTGINMSNQIPHSGGLTGIQVGINIALEGEHFFNPYFGAGFGLSLNEKGENWIDVNLATNLQGIKRTQLYYAELPLMALVKYAFEVGRNKIAFIGKAGFYFSDLIHGNAVLVFTDSSNKTVDISGQGLYEDSSGKLRISPRVSPLDMGYTLGAEIRFNQFGLGFRYQYGLTSIGYDEYYGPRRFNQTYGVDLRYIFSWGN